MILIPRKEPKIAIIGAGLSGLATAWYLLQINPSFQVTLFDPYGVGGQSSLISAGLLHKYSGRYAKESPFGKEGEEATQQLLKISEETLQQSVILSKGILRIPLSDEQESSFKKGANQYADLTWWEESLVHETDPHLPKRPGLFIRSGLSVNTPLYLKGLFQACQRLGAMLVPSAIESLTELKEFDQVICASGPFSSKFPELSAYPIHSVKGQLIEFSWPVALPPLRYSLISKVYLSMSADNLRCIVGATYEHQFRDPFPNPDEALKELLPGIVALYPPLAEAPIEQVRAGIRGSTPSRLPYCGRVKHNLWIIGGMGSRGLLYHAYFASKLANALNLQLDFSE